MSIEAQITQLDQDEQAEKARLKAEEQALNLRIREQRDRELPQALRKQKVLIRELDKLGVFSSIEEFTQGEIPYLHPAPKVKKIRGKITLEKLKKSLGPVDDVLFDLRRNESRRWVAQRISQPTLSNEGLWDTSVRLKIIENQNRMYSTRRGSARWVDLTYTPERILTVSGALSVSVNLKDIVADKKLEMVEEMLATAFRKPAAEQVPQEHWHREPVFALIS